MGEPHVISALTRKRAVIAGELAKAEKRCEAMRNYLLALDNTLRIFGYDGDPADIKPIRPYRAMFRRGKLKRAVLAILRTADGLLTHAEIAEQVIRSKGWIAADAALADAVAEKVKDVRKRLAT